MREKFFYEWLEIIDIEKPHTHFYCFSSDTAHTPDPPHRKRSAAHNDYIRPGNHLVSKQELTRPMARKDIFLGGSLYDLAAEYKSHHSLDTKSHIVSLTNVPDHSQVSSSATSCLQCLHLRHPLL